MAPLAPGSLITIIGITGYIASHAGLEALKAGYRVRGTVRSITKANELRTAYEREVADVTSSALQFVILDDLLSESQWEAALAGADGVIYPALPSLMGDSVVQNIVTSVQLPLEVATRLGIKRFVLTGTLSAAIAPGTVGPQDRLVTEQDWNDDAVALYENAADELKQSPIWYLHQYVAGKVPSERAAWKFMEEQPRPFALTVILPTTNWGPKLYGSSEVGPGSTVGWLIGLLKGDPFGLNVPPLYHVDVRDDAKLHVLALSEEAMAGKRVWAAGEPFGWRQVLGILRKHFPSAPIPEDPAESAIDPVPWRLDNEFATRMVGGEWIGLEQSIVDSAKSFGY